MPNPNSSIIRLLDVLLRMASLFLKKWASDLSDHFEELSDYQSAVKETSSDIVDACVFNTHDCVYGSFISQLFKQNRKPKTADFQTFEMSARTRARIHNEYASDQLRKNSLSLSQFADCSASIQLLSCFRTKGDPDKAIFPQSFLSFCDSFLRTFFQFCILLLPTQQPGLFANTGSLPWLNYLFPQTQNTMKGVL